MIPKTRCSQRSAIISLAWGVSRNEKCGSHSGKEITSRKKFMGTPRTSCASCATTVADCGPARQMRERGTILFPRKYSRRDLAGCRRVSGKPMGRELADKVILHVLDLCQDDSLASAIASRTAPMRLSNLAKTFPLLTERSILYTHLGNRYEQTKRSRARHPRPAPPENPGPGALARLGHQSPPEIHLRRRAAGQRRIPLPCIAQVGAGRLDRGRVEADGE